MMARADMVPSRKLIFAALVTVGALQGGYMVKQIGSADLLWKSKCEIWDREARNTLSGAEHATPPMPGADILESLHRAREYCEAGRIGIALQEYGAVRAAYGVQPTALAATPAGELLK